MTSLQSLLSRFRKSANSRSRKQRSRLDQSGAVSVENLEDRLLLVNPVALSSKPDAPVTIYLEFDGHTESSQAWTDLRDDGQTGPISTPSFSFDGDSGFSQAEIDSITEIYHRVAEDWRPFDINVTTVDPVNLGAQREVEIIVGGDGSWHPGVPRHAAITDSFDNANTPQSAFVFQSRHDGLGGTFEQNIAASISTAAAVTMGLSDRSTEGDTRVAPILGDQIVGIDSVVSNLNSERDIWVNASIPGGGIQDDLAEIVSNTNIDYREDDVGNTDSTSTGLNTVVGTETVTGVIEQNDDVDVFAIATAATNATITVSTLDVRDQFPGIRKTPGTNLDPTLTIRDINGNVVASTNDAGLSSAITADLPSGTYFIEVSNGGEYGNLGEYTLTIDGIDQLPSYANPVSLNSNSGAPVDLFLGFAGGQIYEESETDLLDSRTDGARGTLNLTPYDTDGDATQFSQQEIDEITEIWARVAEDFRPFNVNVTTVNVGQLIDEQSAEVRIGGTEFLDTPAFVSYAGLLNAFTDSTLTNTGVVFSADLPSAGSLNSLPQEVAAFASATFGTMFGLEARTNSNGSPLHTRGDSEVAPIMGAGINALRDIWSSGVTETSAQDSLARITDDLTNDIDYRIDDHSDLIGAATVIPIGAGNEQVTGIIETNGDIDVFRFDTLATTATINITGLNLTSQFAGATNPGSNLDPVLELLDGSGAVIASDDIPFNLTNGNRALTASISQPIGAGTYYIRVTTDGDYGNLGEYTVTLQGVDVVPISLTVDPNVFPEDAGVQVNAGTVGRPDGQVGTSDLVINLFSQDPSELTVPAQVTIPAGAISTNFDVTIVDDTLLDGDQRVQILAQVDGVDNGGTFVTVTDVETIELSITPDPIAENIGSASLTVRRSNTDVDAPNHWVVSDNNLLQYSPAGALVSSVPVEWFNGNPRPLGQNAHDIVIMENGRIAVFNGTSVAGLSVYAPDLDTWEHFGPIEGLTVDGLDQSAGGLATVGDYVFLTDQETFAGDLHGMVRVDVSSGQIDRFGEGTLGARLFAMSSSRTSTIFEFNPTDGSLVNTLTLPLIPGSTGRFTAISVAFDGTDLWVLSPYFAASSFHHLIRVNANTGDLLEVHPMAVFPNDIFLEGIAEIDGTIYLSSTIGVGGGFGQQIQAYDPARRLPLGGTIAVESVNGIQVEDIIGSLPKSNRLLVVEIFGDTIYQIDPNTGVRLDSFAAARPVEFFEPGITSVGDVIFGGVNYDELIYVESDTFFTANTEIDIYTTTGSPIDTDPTTAAIDPITTEVRFTGDLAGNDVPGVETSELRFRDVSLSLDGRLFGLLESGDEISIHDPETLLRLGGIDLDQVVNTIAIGDNSGIYAGNNSGEVIRFNFSGATETSSSTSLLVINDIEVNAGREVIISDAAGNVLITDQDDIESGAVATTSPLENTGDGAFATFGRHFSRTTGDLVVTLASDDLTEIQVPPTVTIPEGQQEITISVSVIDDNERDGAQEVDIIATSTEHQPGQLDVTVEDFESVDVVTIRTPVAENEGTINDALIVSRSDVDGPYTHQSTLRRTVEGPIQIVDDNTITSVVDVPSQVSRITDVDVTLSINHEAIPDLDVYLISPSGTRVELFTDISTNEDQLIETVLDDEAPTLIIDGDSPYTGRFRPEQPLSTFDGENPSGQWALEVIDDNATDVGQLLGWTLDLSTVGLEPLVVTISGNDDSEATVPATVTIPANQSQVAIPLTTVDDNLLDGTQTVLIEVVSAPVNDNFGDFELGRDTVDVTDAETLTITVSSTSLEESADNPAATGTVTRSDNDSTTALVVNLSSSDLTELSVPSTVTIPAGQTSATFDISVVDDQLFDGDQLVTISASAPGFITLESDPITVVDREPRLVLSTVTPTVPEDGGTLTFTLARQDANDLSVPQEVTLSSSDTTEIFLPQTTVTIPAGEFSTSFTANIIDDDLLDGDQTVVITAVDSDTANKVVNDDSFTVTVTDAEYISLAVTSGSATFPENGGDNVAEVTVSLTAAEHTLPIFVSLENSDVTELSVPNRVIIPADSSSATFTVHAVDDVIIDSSQLVRLTARLEGYIDGTLDLTVTDYEPPILTGPTVVTEDPTPSIAWAPLTGAVRYDLWVNDISRNITQLFRHENLAGGISVLEENFESQAFDPNVWDAVTSVEINNLAQNDPSGNVSAHFNGNGEVEGGANGVDSLDSATIDLAGRAGVQLTYSFQKSTSLAPPMEGEEEDPNRVVSGQDLVISYRDADGFWNQLSRQSSSQADFNHFETVRLDLPPEALHSEFALRIESFGPSEPEAGDDPVDRTSWFVDYVEITEHQSFTPEQELGVGRYRAWVRGFDSLNRPTAWSRGMDFRIVTRPEFVTPLNQSFVSTRDFPEVSWTSVVDTDYYDLWVNNITTGESQVIRETRLPTTSYPTELAGLEGGAYRAWTRASVVDVPQTEALRAEALIADPNLTPAELAEIEHLVYGRWSAPVNFTVLATPTVLTPGGATFIRRPEITWTPVEGASNYYVWLARRTPGEAPEVVLRDRFVTDTTRAPDVDLIDGTYVVWVQAISADGTPSRWSEAQTFTVNGNVTVLSPQNSDIVSATPTFQWTAITGTERYEVWVNRLDVPEHQSVYSDDVRGTSFTVSTPLVSGGTYRLWVRAVSEMGEFSFWSFPVTFSVAAVDAPVNPGNVPVVFTEEVAVASVSDRTIVASASRTAASEASSLVVQELSDAEITTETSVQDADSSVESVEIDSVMEEFAVADWSLEANTGQEDENGFAAAGVALGLVASSSLMTRRRGGKKQN